MQDSVLIEKMYLKGKEASEKVKTNFTNTSLAQLNWKPAPESWSIAQCLDHLITADCLYFPELKEITEGKHVMTMWEKWSPFGGLFGKILVTQLTENVKKKMTAPKIFTPFNSSIDAGIIDRF